MLAHGCDIALFAYDIAHLSIYIIYIYYISRLFLGAVMMPITYPDFL